MNSHYIANAVQLSSKHRGVIPAKAGIQCLRLLRRWIPAFAGMTMLEVRLKEQHYTASQFSIEKYKKT
jgi:hypothetical protein